MRTALLMQAGELGIPHSDGLPMLAAQAEKAERLFRAGAEAFLRGQLCTSCRICERNCRFKAITADGQLKVDERLCQQCGECAKACVVAHYYDKLVQAGDGKPVYAGVK
jgi:phosphoadenosine phosphosulfate reductase